MFIDSNQQQLTQNEALLNNEFLSKERPDNCHKCGRCCRSATSSFTHTQLRQMAESGDKDALDFLEVFTPFESIEAARKVVPEQVEQVVNAIKDANGDLGELTFYHCQYVTEEGLCGIYERRPKFCQSAPNSGWSIMPPGCGFEGWQFLKREHQRAEIRKLKEIHFQMAQLEKAQIAIPRDLNELNEEINTLLQPWETYGAKHW